MINDDLMLEVRGLNVHYGDFQALHDISLSIRRGSVVSIIGSNGAGKSTLLNTIMGVNKSTSGTISYLGNRLDNSPTHRIVAKGLALSPEGGRVFPRLTVKENLLIGAYLPEARKNREKTLEKVYSLFPVLREKAGEESTFLSGGQRQMLAIARALMGEPSLLFCDEISLGLAPVIIKDIYRTIGEIRREGLTLVLVEQDVKRSLKHSDYSYVLLKGRIVLEGNSAELSEEDVRDAYFGTSRFASC